MRFYSATLSPRRTSRAFNLLRKLLVPTIPLVLPLALHAQVLSYAGLQTSLPPAGITAPVALAVDAAGTSYILNANGSSITEITASGTQTSCPVAYNSVPMSHPAAIAVDSGGNVFVADSSKNHLYWIAPNCGTVLTAGTITTPISGVAVDSSGNAYFPDPANLRIVEVASGSRVNTTYIGTGQFTDPVSIAIDQNNNLFVLDTGAQSVYEVTITGLTVSVVPVLTGLTYTPSSIAVDNQGNIYLGAGGGQQTVTMYQVPAQLGNSGTVRQLGTGLASPVGVAIGGTGTLYVADQTAPAVDIIAPAPIDIGQANLCPSSGTQTGPCTQTATLNFNVAAGSILTTLSNRVLTLGGDSLDFTATANSCTGTLTGPASCSLTVVFQPLAPGVRLGEVDVSGIVGSAPAPTLLATVPLHGLGSAALAGFDAGQIQALPLTLQPGSSLSTAITDAVGNLYFIDNHACTVGKFTLSTATTSILAGTTCAAAYSAAGSGGQASSATLVDPWRLALNGRGDLYIADDGAAVIWKVDAVTGIITIAAGTLNLPGHSPDGTIATLAQLNHPFALAVDGAGDLYFADWADEIVRKIDADSGVMTTVAGNYVAGQGYSGDGGAATAAQLDFPIALALDPAGNLYIADNHNSVIREVTLGTGNISTLAGMPLAPGYTGDGASATSAQLNDPEGIAVDAAGNLYIADSGNFVVRKVSGSTGLINAVAGINTGSAQNAGNGGAANLAGLGYVQDVAVDSSGNFYIVDSTNSLVDQVTPASGIVNFATFTMGTSSAAIDVAVTNNGNAALNLSALSSVANFNLGGTDTTCTASTILAAGASCVLGVQFLPTAVGPLTASFTLTDDAGSFPGSTQLLALTGTGGYVPTQVVLTGVLATITAGGNLGGVMASVESSGGNVVTNSSAAVTATITGPGGYSQTVSGNASSGVATLDLTGLALTTAGSYTVTAASQGLTSATATVSVTSLPATQVILSTLPASVSGGGNLGMATVSIENASGTVVATSSAAVTVTVTGPGSYSQSVSGNASSGIATLDLSSLVLTGTGTYTVTATSDGLTPATTIVTVVPPPATQLALGGIAPTIVAGGNLGTATASIESANGSVVTTTSAPVTLTITGPGSYTQTLAAVSARSGVATFNLASYPLSSAGTYTVTATSPGLTTAGATVIVTALPSSQLSLAGIPSTIVAGASLGVATASIEAANGTVVLSSTASVTITITGPSSYSQAVTAAAVSGVATIDLSSLTLPAAGSYTATATSAGLPNVVATITATAPTFTLTSSGSGSSTQTIAAGAAATYTFSLGATNLTFAQPVTFTATGLPTGATATFSPATLTPGPSAVTTSLTIQTAAVAAALRNPGSPASELGSRVGGIALALLLLPLAASRRLRRAASQLPMLGLMVGLISLGAVFGLGLTGCGGSSTSTPTPKAQTYTVTVTGTSGATSSATTVTLTVQ